MVVSTESSELIALQEAVKVAAGQSNLARMIEASQAAVWKMLHKARRASAQYVIQIERHTGVSRHRLRPDLYPVEIASPAGRTVGAGAPVGYSDRSPLSEGLSR